MKRRSDLLLTSIVLVAGCDFADLSCDDQALPAIVLEVIDEATGQPLPDAIAWVEDGAYVDTLGSFDGATFDGAHERPGTYDVHAEHDGYEPWLREDVEVEDGHCHVRTRELTARLDPST